MAVRVCVMSDDDVNDALRQKLDLIKDEGGYASRGDALDALITAILGEQSAPVSVPPAQEGAKGGKGRQVIIRIDVPPAQRFHE